MADVLDETSRWLKCQHAACAPNDWLEACVQWIAEEQGNHTLRNTNTLHRLVLEQWLLSDLKEIGAKCLPANILQEKKLMLEGRFCLQINSVLDVGSSFYSQLQKVKGTENENVHVSATQYNKDEEGKSGRMLMLDLTDGTVDIKGMEYKPIRELSSNTKLGTKVIVEGKILCRLGVLMLSSGNIHVVGGEVDTFLTTPEEMLCQALQIKEHFKQEPFSQHFKGQGKKLDSGKKKNTKNKEWGNDGGQNEEWQSGRYSGFNNSRFRREFKPDKKSQEVKEAMEVDWEDEMDDSLLSSIPVENHQSLAFGDQAIHTNDRYKAVNSLATDSVSRRNNMQNKVKMGNNCHALQDIERPKHDRSLESNQFRSRNVTDNFQSKPGVKRTSQHFMDDDSDFDLDELEQLEKVIKVESEATTDKELSSGKDKTQFRDNFQDLSEPLDCNVKSEKFGQGLPLKTESKSSWEIRNRATAVVKQEVQPLQQKYTVINIKPEPESIKPNPFSIKQEPLSSQIVKHEAAAMNQENMYTKSVPPVVKVEPVQGFCNAININNPNSFCVENFKVPFTYLIELKQKPKPAQRRTCRVKAYISTLTGKLEFNNGSFWSLLLQINDGTGVLEASVSDKVLCELIGFSASDCLRVKLKGGKQEKLMMSSGLKNCQRRLIEMSCFMDLEVGGDLQSPVIVRLHPVDSLHTELFCGRQ